MLGTPFTPWPTFEADEIDAVANVLKSSKVNYWTGDEGRRFEKEFASWCGSDYAVAVANGTVALDLAWVALGIGPGDEVILTPRTFLASASSILNAGATPVFADVDPDTQNITPESAARVLTAKTKAILLVHLAGWPCEMDGFRRLADENGLHVVEDCAQAHGAAYRGRPVGAIGDIGCWSFCQDKIMTTGGEGGMVTTNDPNWWSKMWSFKDHGKSYEAVYERQHPPGFRWLHESVGTNWRLTEMQSAIGRRQLTKMADWHAARKRNALTILDAADECKALRAPRPPEHIEHAWYKLYVFVRPEALTSGWSRDRMLAEINARGVPAYSGSCSEIYLEKAFDSAPGRPRERLPVAQELGETALMFLVHPTLGEAEISKTASVLKEVAELAAR